ncbi:putative transcription factor WD40-like family [Helianthus annuus]|nr:putative transcription factor WD40-like family [Helianthus annuus]KAJ0630490.1 putative transcription factor WD40-like family [Helianthus annuus]
MITALSWVPKGAFNPIPSVPDPLSKEEIDQMKKKLALLENSEEDVESEEDMSVDASKQPAAIEQALGAANALGKKAGGSSFPDIADGLDELNMDAYDDEDDAIDILGMGIGDTFYPSNELDPYLKDSNDNDSEEAEDMVIKPEDAVVVCAHVKDEKGRLLVNIIEDPDGEINQYVRNDIDIADFPLCTAWLDCPIKGGEKGNFMAVGMMNPGIGIWDLDIINEDERAALTLGGFAEIQMNKKGNKIKYKEDSHTGPVLALAWNKVYRNILASGSADKTVQALAWNHKEHEVLLSGSVDHTVVMRDGRVPSHSGFKWSVGADVESLAWNPHDQHLFVASLDDGTIVGFDIRTATSNSSTELKPKFTLHAHDKNVCAISYNPLVPNVKLWDLSNNQPSCVASKNLKAGAVFTLSFSEDCPFLLAIAGSRGNLKVNITITFVLTHQF